MSRSGGSDTSSKATIACSHGWPLRSVIGSVFQRSSPRCSGSQARSRSRFAALPATRLTRSARACIITVPVGVLQAPVGAKGAIEFIPALRSKAHALDKLAAGAALRVVLQFRRSFWTLERFAKQRRTETLCALSILHTTDRDFPTWWTAYPISAPVLVAWCGGRRARELSNLARPAIVEHAIDALARQLAVSRRRLHGELEQAWTHDWQNDPFARGAYS